MNLCPLLGCILTHHALGMLYLRNIRSHWHVVNTTLAPTRTTILVRLRTDPTANVHDTMSTTTNILEVGREPVTVTENFSGYLIRPIKALVACIIICVND